MSEELRNRINELEARLIALEDGRISHVLIDPAIKVSDASAAATLVGEVISREIKRQMMPGGILHKSY